MSEDIKLFKACDHYVNKKQYEAERCVRCYGKGYYYDIHFNSNSGKIQMTTGSLKLQQSIIKIILDEMKSNPFHLKWGSEIRNLVGTKNVKINKTKLELMIRTSLEHLKDIQTNQNLLYKNLSSDEILKEVTSIKIDLIGQTGYDITVTISNVVNEIIDINFQL